MPISGRVGTTSIRLPTHIEAISPQKSCGFSFITCGPGAMPWIIRAPIICAPARQDAEARAEGRATQHRSPGVFEVVLRRPEVTHFAREDLALLLHLDV